MNILKNSIFSRFISDEDDEVDEGLVGGILCVWGSPNSGKSIVAAKIAKYLADRRRDTVLVLCDTAAPMLPCLLAPQDLDVEKSMGAILSATHVTPPLVEHNMMTLKNNPHLSIIGMLKGENEYTYASYTRVQAEEMLDCLQEIAPFVIVDCSSYIANDVLSAVSIILSDCDSLIC